jgi:hypothetical protein
MYFVLEHLRMTRRRNLGYKSMFVGWIERRLISDDVPHHIGDVDGPSVVEQHCSSSVKRHHPRSTFGHKTSFPLSMAVPLFGVAKPLRRNQRSEIANQIWRLTQRFRISGTEATSKFRPFRRKKDKPKLSVSSLEVVSHLDKSNTRKFIIRNAQ